VSWDLSHDSSRVPSAAIVVGALEARASAHTPYALFSDHSFKPSVRLYLDFAVCVILCIIFCARSIKTVLRTPRLLSGSPQHQQYLPATATQT